MKTEKREFKGKYKELFHSISEILFENDLQGINFETNEDEYDPEAGTILPRLRQTNTIEDVQHIVHEEFGRWFGDAGNIEDYETVAKEIWAVWSAFKNETL